MDKFLFKAHKWLGVVAALFLLNLAATGMLLLVKKDVAWIQPPEKKGERPFALGATFDDYLAALKTVPEAGVGSWEDVARLDVRPNKGLVKATCKNAYEVQLDASSARVLQVAIRRSDLIESLHDGSFFHSAVHGGLMPGVSVALAFLSLSGVYLALLPWLRRRKKKRAAIRVVDPSMR
jgi:uncharacterized iron-regulated membrane protein